jgi:hypothetical protein
MQGAAPGATQLHGASIFFVSRVAKLGLPMSGYPQNDTMSKLMSIGCQMMQPPNDRLTVTAN